MSLDLQVLHEPYHPGVLPNYNCHGAVIYWAARENGLTPQQSYTLYSKFTRQTNKRAGIVPLGITSIGYGSAFGSLCIPLTTPVLNPAEFTIGDVLIMGHPQDPTHSMIVVGASIINNHVRVRGFNNQRSFAFDDPQPPLDRYDANMRDLANRVYPNDPLYRIPAPAFCKKVKTLHKLLSV